VWYINHPDLSIPIRAQRAGGDFRKLVLSVSNDHGKSFQTSAEAAPDAVKFTFRAPQDGVYWFVAQTVDRDGRHEPPDPTKVSHQLRVCVDTVSPTARLSAERRPGGEVEVIWAVGDENLDLETLRLDYRPAGQKGEWTPLPIRQEEVGRLLWRPADEGKFEVRVRVRDRAGNEAEATGTVPATTPE
jgi:hypothetical protein